MPNGSGQVIVEGSQMSKAPKANARYWRVSVEIDKSDRQLDNGSAGANKSAESSSPNNRKKTVNISFHASPAPLSPVKLKSPPILDRNPALDQVQEDGDEVRHVIEDKLPLEPVVPTAATVTIQVAMKQPPIINDTS